MRHDSIRALYRTWLALAAGRVAPARSEIDPKTITSEIGDLFILDGDTENFAFRLAGSRLVHALGRDVTGSGYLSIFETSSLATANEMLDQATQEGEPVLFSLRDASLGLPRPAPAPAPFERLLRRPENAPPAQERRRAFEGHGEMILLPLTHRGRLGARMMGIIALFEPPQLPRKHPIELSITGTRLLGRQSQLRAPIGPVLGPVPGARSGEVLARHGHLAILRGGKAE
ncbi:PAS domain-containing protein [Rhabdaerophilum sp.]|uniref:PAS domain-containing protein n=1 Tax=Rhabdaerophilum sp. TaxID=2717341 RepID=UPI0038D43F65